MGRITCERCRRVYTWKPELAGRTVRCKCGYTMIAPRDDPDEDSYEIAPEPITFPPPKADSSTQTLAAPPARALAYQTPDVRTTPGVDAYIFDPTKDLHIPLALIAVSTAVNFGELLFRLPDGAKSYGQGLLYLGIGLVIQMGIMLAGLFAAAKLRGLAFGPFWIALMKLCAISLAPGAAYTLFTLLFRPFGVLAAIAGWIISFCLYFALFGVLFDLDESDTWFCVCVIFVLNVLTVFVAL